MLGAVQEQCAGRHDERGTQHGGSQRLADQCFGVHGLLLEFGKSLPANT
jgi:hypothetical protein